MNVKDRIDSLRKELTQHNHDYYVLDNPSISDSEFDTLLRELQMLEDKYPEYFDEDSPTQRVGGDVIESFETINHRYRMLSLGNTYSREDLIDFDARIRKLTDQSFEYVCELKYDGVSISLTYQNGELVQALTRGDGTKGDDVTLNVRTIKSIPLQITGDYPNNFEIRGEIFLPIESFNQMNKERARQGIHTYANPRNTASGSLKLLDPKQVAKRPLDCYLYYLLGDNLPTNSHFENLQIAKKWGFKVPSEIARFSDIHEVFDFVDRWEKQRSELPFEIDGIVIKVDDISLQEEMGFTAKFPRWAISYKFKAEQISSRLHKITYQVGRTGAVTPVANLDPVLLGGTIVKRASLHNADQIEKLDIREGDIVYIEKGGDIIPKVVGVNLNARDMFSSEITRYIKNCPDCGSELIRKEGDAKHYCLNFETCFPQIKGRFEHFIGRRAMNIDGLGGETIELLIKKGLIFQVDDLYVLEREHLLTLGKNVQKSTNNLLLAIEKSKQVPFERVLYALGIRFVGETVSKTLVKNYQNIDSLMNAKFNELVNVDEIGEKIAESVIDYFSQDNNKILINNLKKCGLCFLDKENQANFLSEKLLGMSIVVSGVFQHYSRIELKKIIEKHGGKNVSAISKNTTFVLAGDNMGPSKKEKAEYLGIPIISEEEFINKIR